MSGAKYPRLTIDALACLAAENTGRQVDKHRARRLVDAGMAAIMQDGRCVLKLHARDAMNTLKQQIEKEASA